jgi:hypothetical protein
LRQAAAVVAALLAMSAPVEDLGVVDATAVPAVLGQCFKVLLVAAVVVLVTEVAVLVRWEHPVSSKVAALAAQESYLASPERR